MTLYRTFRTSSVDGKPVCYERRDLPTSSSAIRRDTVVVFVHALGLCKEVWRPVIEDTVRRLEDTVEDTGIDRRRELREVSFVSVDLRGHGDSWKRPINEGESASAIEIEHLVDGAWRDLHAVVDDVRRRSAGRSPKILGFAHSRGGAAAIIAQLKRPSTFDALTLYEPFMPPPFSSDRDTARRQSDVYRKQVESISRRCLKQRRPMASREDAFRRLKSAFPYRHWDERVLRAYADHGYSNAPGQVGGEILTKCSPALQASLYLQHPHEVPWSVLESISIRVNVVSGDRSQFLEVFSDGSTADLFRRLSEQFAVGFFEVLPNRTHYGPFEEPDQFARLVVDLVCSEEDSSSSSKL